MVEERLADGTRIAQLLASELDGRDDGRLASLSVVEANHDVEPTAEGAFAYAIEQEQEEEEPGDGRRLCSVFVHPDRAHVELAASEGIVEAAENEGLRVRPKATHPPKTLVFVESGAEVKRAVSVVVRAAQSN